MATPPKPDDKTLQVPAGAERPTGSSPLRPQVKSNPQLKLGAEADAPSYSNRDSFGGTRSDVKPLAPGKAAAAEVSQGAWRERAFQPRGVMSPDEIVKGLSDVLAGVRTRQAPKSLMLAKVRDEWLQFLRQAVEQAGGDCLDAWLTAALKPGTGTSGINLILVELYVAFEKMRAAHDTGLMLEIAEEAIVSVKNALEAPSKRPCSFKVLERELEGKIDVDGLVLFLLASDDELTQRAKDIGQTLERLRDEVKKMPGAKPDGMYSNFARLKAEARVIDGELKRRARATR